MFKLEDLDIIGRLYNCSNLKSYSKIIYYMSKLPYANSYSLYNNLAISKSQVTTSMNKLIGYKIIKIINSNHDDYDIINKYHKSRNPNSNNKCEFYKISNNYINTINNMNFDKYILESEKREIDKKINDFSKFKLNYELNRKQAVNCIECNQIIKAFHKEGKHFFKYAGNIVCRNCSINSTKEKVAKWIAWKY